MSDKIIHVWIVLYAVTKSLCNISSNGALVAKLCIRVSTALTRENRARLCPAFLENSHFIQSGDSDYLLWCIVVVNAQETLHLGAVTQNLDTRGIFSDSRSLTGLYLCLSGVTLLWLPKAYLWVMRVTEGRGTGGFVWSSRGAPLPQQSGRSVKIRQAARASCYRPWLPDCSVFLEWFRGSCP